MVPTVAAATPPCGPPRKSDLAAVTRVTGAGPVAVAGLPTLVAAVVATRTSDLAVVGCATTGPVAVVAATAKATKGVALPPVPEAAEAGAFADGPLAAAATPITFTVPLGLATTCTAPAGMPEAMAAAALTAVGF